MRTMTPQIERYYDVHNYKCLSDRIPRTVSHWLYWARVCWLHAW